MGTEKRKRNFYTPEFKREAVERSKAIGVTKTKDELGISLAALTRWRKEFSENPSKLETNKPSYEELEKEVRRQKKKMDILKRSIEF